VSWNKHASQQFHCNNHCKKLTKILLRASLAATKTWLDMCISGKVANGIFKKLLLRPNCEASCENNYLVWLSFDLPITCNDSRNTASHYYNTFWLDLTANTNATNTNEKRICSVFTPGIDRIIVDYFGLNTVSLLANTPPFAHTTNLFNSFESWEILGTQ